MVDYVRWSDLGDEGERNWSYIASAGIVDSGIELFLYLAAWLTVSLASFLVQGSTWISAAASAGIRRRAGAQPRCPPTYYEWGQAEASKSSLELTFAPYLQLIS